MFSKLTIIKNTIKSKLEQVLRLILVNHCNKFIPFFLLVEYPKSGGTWLSQLLADYLQIPFPRNTLPKFSNSIVHGHYRPKKNFHNIPQIILLVRDGRDVMISLYHHYLIWNEKNRLNPKDVNYHRSHLKFENYFDVEKNLPFFIEYAFCHKPSIFQQFTFMGNWSEFNKSWLQFSNRSNNIFMIKYEDLLKDTYTELYKLLSKGFQVTINDQDRLMKIVEKYSFENQTNRKKGTENRSSFLRKGISGDWKNYFNKNSALVFQKYAGNMLVDLGYEQNHLWVNKF